MFTPKYPTPDTAPAPITRVVPAASVSAVGDDTLVVQSAPSPVPMPAPVTSNRPTVQLTPGAVVTVAVGGTAAVLVVGAVLVSMLLAIAVTGVSVAICAVVLRSLVNNGNKAR